MAIVEPRRQGDDDADDTLLPEPGAEPGEQSVPLISDNNQQQQQDDDDIIRPHHSVSNQNSPMVIRRQPRSGGGGGVEYDGEVRGVRPLSMPPEPHMNGVVTDGIIRRQLQKQQSTVMEKDGSNFLSNSNRSNSLPSAMMVIGTGGNVYSLPPTNITENADYGYGTTIITTQRPTNSQSISNLVAAAAGPAMTREEIGPPSLMTSADGERVVLLCSDFVVPGSGGGHLPPGVVEGADGGHAHVGEEGEAPICPEESVTESSITDSGSNQCLAFVSPFKIKRTRTFYCAKI